MAQYPPVGKPAADKPANERQVGGEHYKGASKSGVQHWDMAWDFGLDFFQYQITKHLFRWRRKLGVEDLRKAQHYFQKYIEVIQEEQGTNIAPTISEMEYAKQRADAIHNR
jgi:hypothetical protein